MKTFRDIFNIIFIPSLLIAVPYFIICLPVLWGVVPFEVTFDSMNPSYTDGELVYYELVSSTDIKPNDLVVFDDTELENNRIFHRVIEVRSDGLVTKGDAKEYNDVNILKYDEVIGKVKDNMKFPMIGPYVKFANSNILFIYGAVGIWIIYFIISFFIIKGDFKVKKMKQLELQQAGVAPNGTTPAVAPTSAEAPAPTPEAAGPAASPAEPAPTTTPAVETAPAATPTPAEAPAPTPEATPSTETTPEQTPAQS